VEGRGAAFHFFYLSICNSTNSGGNKRQRGLSYLLRLMAWFCQFCKALEALVSIYIIVWFLISAFLLGFWVWSGYMSYKQKKAWRFFADKKKMRYHSAAFFQSPTISGVVDEYSVSVNILINLMRLEKAWVIVLFNGSEGLLRLDTPRPIDTPKEMDVLVKQMITVAKALELNKGEERDLLREESLSAKTSKVLDIDDDLLDDHLGIELEEDDVELPASKDKKSKK